MPFLELLIELLSSFDFPVSNGTSYITDDFPKAFPKNIKSETISDIFDCAKAHEEIERGNAKKISPFVSYTEVKNEVNGRKTTADQVRVPLYATFRACITGKDIDKPADTGN
jgi:hypothetical protein